jgi:hypothetical protein
MQKEGIMLFDFMSGGLSYDPAIVVANTAARLPWVLLFSGLAFLGGFVQMIAGLWMGFKHKTHGVPLLCAAWFFAHDTTYFLNYNHWFREQDFWVAQGAWFQMGFYMITELIVMFQIMKYSRGPKSCTCTASNRIDDLRPHVPGILSATRQVKPGEAIFIGA